MSSEIKLSVVMHTCRNDSPGQLPAPILQMMVDGIMAQEFSGAVELIIVDLLWERRHEEFDEILKRTALPASGKPIPVLHVPDRSTPFKDEKLLRICSPKNTGILLARGTHVVFTDDCQVLPKTGLARLAQWAEKGFGATTNYEKRIFAKDGNHRVTGSDLRGVQLGVHAGTGRNVSTRAIGFLGGTLSMLPLEALLALNGWDEGFDGSRQLEDGDMIVRLGLYGQKMAYENRNTVVEYEVGNYDKNVVRTQPIKCNGAYAQHVWKQNRVLANTGYDAETIERMAWGDCIRLTEGGRCSPHNGECTHLGNPEQLARIFTDERLVFDLREERKRINWDNALDILSA